MPDIPNAQSIQFDGNNNLNLQAIVGSNHGKPSVALEYYPGSGIVTTGINVRSTKKYSLPLLGKLAPGETLIVKDFPNSAVATPSNPSGALPNNLELIVLVTPTLS